MFYFGLWCVNGVGWWLILDFSALAARDGVLFLSFWTSRRRGESYLELLEPMLKILIINILLSGDNAIVIAMASRNLPEHLQKELLDGDIRCNCITYIICLFNDQPTAITLYSVNWRHYAFNRGLQIISRQA